MLNKVKIKKMLKEIKRAYYNLSDNLKEIYNKDIVSDSDAREKLTYDPSVETLFEVEHYVLNKPCKNSVSKPYELFDFAEFDDNVSYAKRNEILTNIFDKLGLNDVILYRIQCSFGTTLDGHLHSEYLFKIGRGRNGSGDFVDVDMKEVTDIIHILRENGATSATVVDVWVDPADDLSDWVIGFRLDEDV